MLHSMMSGGAMTSRMPTTSASQFMRFTPLYGHLHHRQKASMAKVPSLGTLNALNTTWLGFILNLDIKSSI